MWAAVEIERDFKREVLQPTWWSARSHLQITSTRRIQTALYPFFLIWYRRKSPHGTTTDRALKELWRNICTFRNEISARSVQILQQVGEFVEPKYGQELSKLQKGHTCNSTCHIYRSHFTYWCDINGGHLCWDGNYIGCTSANRERLWGFSTLSRDIKSS